jgi:WhiB family redox-sensing transcriptional regulator
MGALIQFPARHTAVEIDDEDSWQDEAACLGVDVGIFFRTDTAEAKEVCSRCRVRQACLEQAIVDGERFGVWGGLTERERRRLRKRRTVA